MNDWKITQTETLHVGAFAVVVVCERGGYTFRISAPTMGGPMPFKDAATAKQIAVKHLAQMLREAMNVLEEGS
jgi:hypothetical protein